MRTRESHYIGTGAHGSFVHESVLGRHQQRNKVRFEPERNLGIGHFALVHLSLQSGNCRRRHQALEGALAPDHVHKRL